MTEIHVRPVTSHRELRLLLTLPWKIYKNDPLWRPPLLSQRLNRFNPAKNPVVSGGKVESFIAWREGEAVGTIVAAIDEQRNRQWDEDRAMFGFFECVEDYDVAVALFDTAVEWAKRQGKSSLWGPWYLDYEDSHGFLVNGWDRAPVVLCGHTPPYYADFAERYGLTKTRRDSVAFAYDIPEDRESAIPEKLARVAYKLMDRSKVVVRTADFDRWDEEIKLAVDVLNRGLAVLGDSRGFWDVDRMEAHARDLKPVLDPSMVLLAEVDGQAVGWIFGLPDLSQAVAASNGGRYPWNKLQLLLNVNKQPDCISLKSAAVDPNYWNRGIETLMGYQFAINAIERGYKWVDMSLTGEDNPMTPRIATRLGAYEYKRYRIYELSGWN